MGNHSKIIFDLKKGIVDTMQPYLKAVTEALLAASKELENVSKRIEDPDFLIKACSELKEDENVHRTQADNHSNE